MIQTHTSPCGCQCIYIRGSTLAVLTRHWHKHDTLFDLWPLSSCRLIFSHMSNSAAADNAFESLVQRWESEDDDLAPAPKPVLPNNTVKTHGYLKTEKESKGEGDFLSFPAVLLSLHTRLLCQGQLDHSLFWCSFKLHLLTVHYLPLSERMCVCATRFRSYLAYHKIAQEELHRGEKERGKGGRRGK